MKKEKLKIYCAGCNAKIDLSDQASFSQVNCPACSTVITVPKKMGNIFLLEKLNENRYFDNYRGLLDSREVSVKVFKTHVNTPLSELKNHKIELRDIEGQNVAITPWMGESLKPLNNSSLKEIFELFQKICDSLINYSDSDIFFSAIAPEFIYLINDKVNFTDSILIQSLKGKNEANITTSIQEAGKIFNYLIFDHSESYETWTEKYIQKNIESNYFQFPWSIKNENSEGLRKLVRQMILKPEAFKDFSEIKEKLSAEQSSINKVKTSRKVTKPPIEKPINNKINGTAEKAANKINRSIRRSKKNQNSLSSILPFALIAAALAIVFFLTNNSDNKISNSEVNETEAKITKNSKIDTESAKLERLNKIEEENILEELKRKEELAHLDEVRRKKEMARLEELKKKREAEKQEELKKFLAVINPSDAVKAKYKSLPEVSSSHLLSLMNNHCNDCHNSKKRKGDFVLDVFTQPSSIFRDYEVIKHAYESVKLGDMPPDDEDISDSERQSLIDYFEKIIYTLESKQIDVKSSALIRRLTPYEYDYTVKDITGLDLKLGESFPGDGGGNQGFANDASLMGVSPIQMEKFLNAAETISEYSSFDLDKGFQFHKQENPLLSAQDYETQLEKQLYKNYKIYPRGFTIPTYLPKLIRAATEITLNKNNSLKSTAAKYKVSPLFLERLINYLSAPGSKSSEEIKAMEKWKKLTLKRFKKPNERQEAIKKAVNEFVGKYLKSKIELSNTHNRNRFNHIKLVQNIESIFHLDQETASKFISGKTLISYNRNLEVLNFLRFTRDIRRNKTAYHQLEPIVLSFLKKVYRRPPSKSKLFSMTNDLLKDSLKFGMPLASRIFIIRTFSSFNFTFRIEEKKSRKIDDFDLASRLSYFLWSGPPDNELLTLAENGKLNDEQTLSNQIKRMLKNPKSDRLAKHFASQWLRFGDILEFEGPSEKVFKGFDKNLAKDMWQESAMNFNYIVKNDRSILEIFNADYTFVNKRLSDLYGLNQNSSSFRKVYIKNGQRGGILGHASILTMTSFGQRTSPIIRGNWILSVLMGTPTPPPPMNVDALPEEDVISENFTLKQQLAKHRDSPACRGCHKKIDPLGIVLENYDVVGRWRTSYQKAKVENESTIAGTTLKGPADLKEYLMKNKIQYIRNLSRKLLSYSLGRSIYYYDNYLINKMIENAIRNDYEFSALVKTIVLSPQFQLK